MNLNVDQYLPTHGANKRRSYLGAMMNKGEFAEETVLRWLQDFPDVVGVDDFRQLRVMQKTDVDCAIYFIEGHVLLAEIKSDVHLRKDGNVTYEYLRINHTAPPDRNSVLGWTARTPAKWVLFYAPQECLVYRFETEVMQKVFQTFTRERRPKHGGWLSDLDKLKLYWVSTDEIKSTLICCLPLSAFPPQSIRAYDVSKYLQDDTL
jgi:hypothetical protein